MSKLDQETIKNVKRLHREGVSRKEIARRVWVSLSTVYRILNDLTPDVQFTRVEGDKACTYKLIKVEQLKDVLEERGAVGTPVQCQDEGLFTGKPMPPKSTNPSRLTYDPADAKNVKYIAPCQKASVLAADYIGLLVESYHPAIPSEFRVAIKARAMDTFRGFDGSLRDMAQKAVHHAVKEAAIR